MATTPHRIKIKLGDSEFEAEGAADSVQAQYEQFLSVFEKSGQRTGAAAGKAKQEAAGDGAPVTETSLARIFELRPDGLVTLKVLPKGDDKEANAFLLLLLGYRRLKNEEHVLATHLLRAAEHSGITAYRPAHALSQHEQYVMRGGFKKGSTYSLNNQGVAKAEEIAAKMLE